MNPQQIAAYEREISKLKEELLKEIGHLEEKKEEAVKAAANCSPEHFQNLQEQFFSESVTKPFYDVFADKEVKDLPLLKSLASAKLIKDYLAYFHLGR